MGNLNARCLRNKLLNVQNSILDHDLDMLAITETWPRSDLSDQVFVREAIPKGYRLRSAPRIHGQGGGVAIIYKDFLSVTQRASHDYF